jgi:hypothetical protein
MILNHLNSNHSNNTFHLERRRQPLQRSKSRHSSGVMTKHILGEHSLRGHRYEVNINIPQLKHGASSRTIARRKDRLEQRMQFTKVRPGL